MQLQDPGLVTNCSARLLGQPIGLMFAPRGLLRGNTPPVATCKGLANGHNGWFAITLEDELVLSASRMAPGLEFLVHVLD